MKKILFLLMGIVIISNNIILVSENYYVKTNNVENEEFIGIDDNLYYSTEDGYDDYSTEIIPPPLVLPPKQLLMPPGGSVVVDDSYVPNSTFMANYYSHLGKNYPTNHLGICGYTAISMLLLYYDTYWNDNFILDNYEQIEQMESTTFTNGASHNSPGVIDDLKFSPSIDNLVSLIPYPVDSVEFKAALDTAIMGEIMTSVNNPNSFAGLLFSIALENGSIVPHNNPNYYSGNNNYLNGIGVNNTIMNNVLSDYISGNNKIANSVTYSTSAAVNTSVQEKNRIRNEIIQIVQSGKPVMVGGNGYDDINHNGTLDSTEHSFGHVVVIYEYDSTADILYGNMGWGNNPSNMHRNMDAFFNIRMQDYWSLNIDSTLPQSYTNNYIFSDKKVTYSPYGGMYKTLVQTDYNFEPQYFFYEKINTINLPDQLLINQVTFTRLRTGYIENQTINLSPCRTGAGSAYLVYYFNRPINRININMSWWSSNENVTQNNSDYRIEYLVGSTWLTAKDLWRDITLSTDRWTPTNLDISFISSINSFRVSAAAPYNGNNTHNKGRLCIFDMKVFVDQ
ncbi:MAG: hypothetical protein LBM99_02460 [Bacillales bacterium]|jgi:hypothetical protein|nr:hypothetical protein [Bacillales bacterium]